MKQITSRRLVLGSALIALMMPLSASSAPKLTVTDSGGTTQFLVDDTGVVGVGVASPLYTVDVSGGNAARSEMHFSYNGDNAGGFVTSVLDNNFFLSSGAKYDSSVGGWIQESSDGNSVIAGSGGAGYRVFTSSGNAAGAGFTPTVRLHIDYNGELGINTAAVSGYAIYTSSGAYLSGGAWTNGSSREYKDHIKALSGDEAMQAFAALKPVTFTYKSDAEQQHVGFIAEDVPELVATKDRKGLSAMDVVAVLTKVVQEQKQMLDEDSRAIEEQKADAAQMKQQLSEVMARLQRIETLNMAAQR